MTTLLVLTVGQSDVQLVVDGTRRELCKESCARLYDELGQRVGDWQLVDSPDGKAEPAAEALPAGKLLLCTPKLDAVLRYLDEHRIVPKAVLVLETRRDAKAAPGDPRFAGAVLEARLKDKGIEEVNRRAYLENAERLENRNQPRDAVIRREVVQRLEQAVRESLETLMPSRVILATSGGFPVVTNLVEEIVRLHASMSVDALEVADGTRANPPTGDRAVARTSIPEPLISFQARRRALELVAKGDLLGAWATAEPLHNDDTERPWTQVVEWLACFASSLPMPDSCDISILTHKRMAVRAALRVELALRAGDIPRAIHGTVAFLEAALWDHLEPHVERHPSRSRLFKLALSPPPELVRDASATDNGKRPFEFKETVDNNSWYWIHDERVCCTRLAKRYLKLDRLEQLAKASDPDAWDLRNDVAHNEPTPARMDDARRRMAAAQLWSQRATFLTQPLVQEVLRELGELHPESLCDDLLRTIRTRLLAGLRP